MKKNNLILLLLIMTSSMVVSMKRAKPEEEEIFEIEEIKTPEQKRHRAEDIPQSPRLIGEPQTPPEKKSAVPSKAMLKIPGNFAGIELDLADTREALAADTIYNLIQESIEETTPFILAQAITVHEEKRLIEYYELNNIHTFFWGKDWARVVVAGVGSLDFAPEMRNKYVQLRMYDVKTPTRATATGELNYFIYNPSDQTFDFFANDYILFKNTPLTFPARRFLANMYSDSAAKALKRDTKDQTFATLAEYLFQQDKIEAAMYWFKKTLELINKDPLSAERRLGFYLNSPKKDPVTTLKAGYLYQKGFGYTKPAYEKAREKYNEIISGPASINNAIKAEAFYQLGVLDEEGRGWPGPNVASAQTMYETAAKLGNKKAAERLKSLGR